MTLTYHERIRQYRESLEIAPQGDLAQADQTPEEYAPPADPFVDVRDEVRRQVISVVGARLFRGEADEDLLSEVDTTALDLIRRNFGHIVTGADREQMLQDLRDEILGLGPIERLLKDETVSEVMCNGPSNIYVERNGIVQRTDTVFNDDQHLLRVIERIVASVNRRIDEASPMVDARLQDGSRVHAIIPPLSLIGPCLTIRKFREDPYTMEDLVRMGTLTQQSALFLEECIKGAANVLISGGTGSGKTTTLNVLSSAIPENQRIVTIEDAAELKLDQEHVIPLETRPSNADGQGEISIRDLVRTSLRMRPDRIVVGECRGPEALDMLQSMNTGHDGSMTTIHANNPREAMSRLETLVLTAGTDLPLQAIRDQIAGAVDLVVQVSRLVDGTRRITAITEVAGMESGVVTLQDLFVAKPEDDCSDLYGPLRATGVVPRFLDKLTSNGVTVPPSRFRLTE
jgi:pilus assembly protein CpaF